jgi:hypothetical protein
MLAVSGKPEIRMVENVDSAREARTLSMDRPYQLLAFLCLLAFTACLEWRTLSALRDPEIWGHLRAGTWMLQNRSFPVDGLFSQSSNLPWRDFSWGFAAVAAIAFRIAGYASLPVILIILRIGLSMGTFLLAGGWRNFWPATALSVVAQYVLLAMGPGPAYVSALLFALEARMLWEVRETGDMRRLLWLPLLFMLWANFDTGFLFGIGLYLVFLIAFLIEERLGLADSKSPDDAVIRVPLPRAAWIGAACIAASLLNPYGFHPYVGFFAAELSPVNQNLPAYNAMGFRQPQDYILMLLGMAGFLALGLARSRDFFQIGALAGCAALAFHAQREGWLLALIAVAVIGHAIRPMKRGSLFFASQWNATRLGVLTMALTFSLGIFFLEKGRNQDLLSARVAENFPVGAANFLRQHQQPTPLFNDYKWGAFLTWYLPEYPVAIDSRRGLYPEEMELGYFKAMKAEIPYREYPPMNEAHTFLLDKSSVMGQAFRGVSGFQVMYEDDLAIIYLHESKEQP